MKLSTSAIKSLMKSWLATLDPKRLDHYTDMHGAHNHREERYCLDEAAESFNFKQGCTSEELRAHIYGLWCDPNQWNREEKYKLGNEWESYFACESHWEGWGKEAKHTPMPGFTQDELGDNKSTLVEKYFNDPKQAEKCILRMFVPKSQLGDSYRLEVVTTPEDDAVIGWVVIVD